MVEAEELARILDAVDALQEATLDTSRWARALSCMSALIEAEGGTVEVHDLEAGELTLFEWSGICSEGAQEFAQHYRFCSPRQPVIDGASPLEVSCDRDHMTEAQIDRSEFYQDFLRPHGLRYYVGGVLWREARTAAAASFQLSTRRGHADERAIRRMRLLMPHLAHATRLALRLRGLERDHRDLRDATDRLPIGIALVDGRGDVVFLNETARRATGPGAPLRVRRGRLLARRPSAQQMLEASIASAVSSRCLRAPVAIRLDGPRDPEPLAVTVTRLSTSEQHRPWAGRRPRAEAMVVVSRPGREPAAPLLRTLFDLTAAEADLAETLVRGGTMGEHAERRGVSINTVRTHSARLKAKVGAGTQTEAVARMRDLLAPLRA